MRSAGVDIFQKDTADVDRSQCNIIILVVGFILYFVDKQ